MKKIYSAPVADVIAFSSEENILAGSPVGPASIHDSYTDAAALSNFRDNDNDWDEE